MAKKHYNQTVGFADRLNQAISDMGISKKKLGELIGCDRRNVYEWCWGDTMPNALLLARMCKVLNVSADYLLFGERGNNG